jgi:hypothetical protein
MNHLHPGHREDYEVGEYGQQLFDHRPMIWIQNVGKLHSEVHSYLKCLYTPKQPKECMPMLTLSKEFRVRVVLDLNFKALHDGKKSRRDGAADLCDASYCVVLTALDVKFEIGRGS